MRWLLGFALLAAACGSKDTRNGILTPEDVSQNSKDGDTVIVEGTVHTLTFDDVLGSDDLFTPGVDRWLLIRTERPAGVTLEDLDTGNTIVAWGLGIHIPGDKLDDIPLPQIGDKVHVTGTFQHVTWASVQVPVVEDATIEILETDTTLATVGATCSNDLDCHDRLICDRATTKCAAPPEVLWGSDFRNLNGACSTDAECPLGQRCDPSYTIVDTGDFAPAYYMTRDVGKFLCVPETATLAATCPRVLTPADLSGGRFVAGKEVCIRAPNWLSIQAEDRDTHVQMAIEEPLPYPAADTPYYIFGSTSENGPMYKDPSRPQGAIADPRAGDITVAVGTVRYDDSHGWWELHPIKIQFPESSAKAESAARVKRWKTHPGHVDLEELEESWGKSEKDMPGATGR